MRKLSLTRRAANIKNIKLLSRSRGQITYTFAIGSYIIDRNGKLSGEKSEELAEALAAQGFTAV